MSQPNNLAALLLGLVTGWGHLYLGHYVRGAILFGVFVTALNGVFLGSTLHTVERPEVIKWASIGVAASLWLGGLVHVYLLSYGTDRAKLAREKEELLREALLDYLRDALEDAIGKLERAARLDVDWQDPDPLFHLGVIQLRLAEQRAAEGDGSGARRARRRAQAAYRSCQARDLDGKWSDEVTVELGRLRRKLTVTGRVRPHGERWAESTDMLPPLAEVTEVEPEAAEGAPVAPPVEAEGAGAPADGDASASSGPALVTRDDAAEPAAAGAGSSSSAEGVASSSERHLSRSSSSQRRLSASSDSFPTLTPTGQRPSRRMARRMRRLMESGELDVETGQPVSRGGDDACGGADPRFVPSRLAEGGEPAPRQADGDDAGTAEDLLADGAAAGSGEDEGATDPPADGPDPPADGPDPPADGPDPSADGPDPPADGPDPPADGPAADAGPAAPGAAERSAAGSAARGSTGEGMPGNLSGERGRPEPAAGKPEEERR